MKTIESQVEYNEVYWDFEALRGASAKMKSLFVVLATQKSIDDVYHYHYNQAIIYLDFVFDKFITAIQRGHIMFDIRIGVYNSGKNYGKPHDHGSGFRVKRGNLGTLFLEEIHIE